MELEFPCKRGLAAATGIGVQGPVLGLSNARSALHAYQLRQQIQESKNKLIGISGDWTEPFWCAYEEGEERTGRRAATVSTAECVEAEIRPEFHTQWEEVPQARYNAVEQMRELQAFGASGLLDGHDPDDDTVY